MAKFIELQQDDTDGGIDSHIISITVLVPGSPNRKVAIDLTWSVKELREKLFEDILKSGKMVRLVYQGVLLASDESTVGSYGIKGDSSLHACVSVPMQAPHDSSSSHIPTNHGNEDEDTILLVAALAQQQQQEEEEEDYESETIPGSAGDFFCGFALGYVLGPFMLLWLWQRGIPRRLRIGIILGVLLKVVMTLPRLMSQQQDDKNTNDSSNGETGEGS